MSGDIPERLEFYARYSHTKTSMYAPALEVAAAKIKTSFLLSGKDAYLIACEAITTYVVNLPDCAPQTTGHETTALPSDFLSRHFTHGEYATAYRAILLWEEGKRINQQGGQTMKKTFKDGNTVWLRERAEAIRRGDRPEMETEWLALAEGLDMIADAYSAAAEVALDAVVAVDVLTSKPGEGQPN